MSYTGSDTIEKIALNFNVPEPFYTNDVSIVIPSLGKKKGFIEFSKNFLSDSSRGSLLIPVHFYAKTNILPSSLVITATAAYTNPKGEPRTTQIDINIPLYFVCRVVPVIKASSFKITIDTNRPPLGLNSLFEEVLQVSNENTSTAVSVLSFKYLSGHDATILVSKNAGRYRIQSSSSFESMWLITQEILERLALHFRGGADKEAFKISFTEDLPLQDYFRVIDAHFAVTSIGSCYD